MCGIVGFNGNFARPLLDEMNGVQRHRGPDDAGLFFDPEKRLGFGHRRLSIIDLSALGRQPMWDVRGEIVITYNGEIYNYRELRRELVDQGFRFNSRSDTEVILNLYRRDGTRLLDKLIGIFAFALYDSRKNELLLARDGFGVKPLYYSQTPEGLLFASELKALLRYPQLDRELDRQALACYLTYLWSPGERTALRSVKKLLPGHAFTVRDGKIRESWCFYDLPYSAESRDHPVAEAVSLVRGALDAAVQRQLVADVPVGAFLSGGLDSSAIVALARPHNPEIACFTIGFKDRARSREGFTDDLPYARRVAQHLNVRLHTIHVGPEMCQQLERMIYHLDEPQADPAAINTLFICQLAKERGIKVLLSGTGGDDILSGYRRHFALMKERYWTWLPAGPRRSLSLLAGRLPGGPAASRRLKKAFQYAHLPEDRRLISYFFWTEPETVRGLLDLPPEETAGIDPFGPLAATLSRIDGRTHPLNKMLYLEGKHFLADHNLNYTDKMSMSQGVEVRVPFLDPDLVRLCAGLPPSMKQHNRTGKWILKKAMEPDLPRDVIYRPKTGFGVPLRQWLNHELEELVADLLSPASLKARGLFDPGATRRFIERDRQNRTDGSYTIFALICIELWCRIFLDRSAVC